MYVVPSTGGSPKMFVDSTHGVDLSPVWSPDGSKLAYADSRGVHVVPAPGRSSATNSTAASDSAIVTGNDFHDLAWSPDGRKLAYLQGNSATLINRSAEPILKVDIASRNVRQVAGPEWINLRPVWTPDGGSLLYISNRDGPSDVYQQAVDGSGAPSGEPKRVTTGLNANRISMSADGKRLPYDVLRNRSNIWEVELKKGQVVSTASARRVTAESQRSEMLSVSNDGKWVAFDSDRNGNCEMFKVAADPGVAGDSSPGRREPVQLTMDHGNDFGPSWAADGKSLLVNSSRSGKRDVCSIGADGTNERQLTHTPFELYMASSAPDGKAFVVMARDMGKVGTVVERTPTGIFRQGANGEWSLTRRLVPEVATWARWSRDGRWSAYAAPVGVQVSYLARVGSLRIVAADGGGSRELFDGSRGESVMWLAWGDDPAVLYFSTIDGRNEYRFYEVPVSGGAARVVMRDGPDHRLGGQFFGARRGRLYVSLAADESDVFVMELQH